MPRYSRAWVPSSPGQRAHWQLPVGAQPAPAAAAESSTAESASGADLQPRAFGPAGAARALPLGLQARQRELSWTYCNGVRLRLSRLMVWGVQCQRQQWQSVLPPGVVVPAAEQLLVTNVVARRSSQPAGGPQHYWTPELAVTESSALQLASHGFNSNSHFGKVLHGGDVPQRPGSAAAAAREFLSAYHCNTFLRSPRLRVGRCLADCRLHCTKNSSVICVGGSWLPTTVVRGKLEALKDLIDETGQKTDGDGLASTRHCLCGAEWTSMVIYVVMPAVAAHRAELRVNRGAWRQHCCKRGRGRQMMNMDGQIFRSSCWVGAKCVSVGR